MADDRLDVAVDVVARDLIAKVVREYGGDQWDSYPEIGEHDWERIDKRALELAAQVDGEQYLAAYEFLESRANKDVDV